MVKLIQEIVQELAKQESLSKDEVSLIEEVLERAPKLNPVEALKQLRAAGM